MYTYTITHSANSGDARSEIQLINNNHKDFLCRLRNSCDIQLEELQIFSKNTTVCTVYCRPGTFSTEDWRPNTKCYVTTCSSLFRNCCI